MSNQYNQPPMQYNNYGQYMPQQQFGQQQTVQPNFSSQQNTYTNAYQQPQQQQQQQQNSSLPPSYSVHPPPQQTVYRQHQHQQNSQLNHPHQYQPHPLQHSGFNPPNAGVRTTSTDGNTVTTAANSTSSNYAMTRPPFVDPETQIVYPCNNPEFEGWLTKQSMWLKDWRRRYFLLSGSKLFFCKNPYGAPHGMIDLSTATTVKSADIKSQKKNSFEISTSEMTYLMYADSDKEKDDWIGSVGRAIVRASGTFLQKNEVEDDDGDADDDEGVFENSENHPYFND